MNSIILPSLVLAVAVAIADSERKGKCGGEDVPLCALVYDRKAPPIPPPKPDCSKCVAEAYALRMTDKTVRIPTCNKDDSFKRAQYDALKNESFCATPYGEEVKGTRLKGKKIRCKSDKGPVPTKCQASRAKAKRTKAKHVPTCNKAGEYHHIQFFSTKSPFGWCALKSGKPVPDSFFTKGEERTHNCVQHRVTKLNCMNREGMVKHPFDCKRYLQCGADTIYTCICPHGQAFNTSLKVCDWMDNIKGCPPRVMPRKHHGGMVYHAPIRRRKKGQAAQKRPKKGARIPKKKCTSRKQMHAQKLTSTGVDLMPFFVFLDDDGCNTISVDELKTLTTIGDADNNGVVREAAFEAAWGHIAVSLGIPTEKHAKIFKLLDGVDGSAEDGKIVEAENSALFSRFDKDGSGDIDFDEFFNSFSGIVS